MKVQLVDKMGSRKGETLELADTTFGVAFNEPLVHQVVTAYLAAGALRHQGPEEPLRRERLAARSRGSRRARAARASARSAARSGSAVAARSPRARAASSRRSIARCTAARCARCCPSCCARSALIVADELGVSAPKTKQLESKLDAVGFTHGADRRRGVRREPLARGAQPAERVRRGSALRRPGRARRRTRRCSRRPRR